MFVRAREFLAQRLADFSETGVARQLFAELVAIITTLDGYAAAQAAGIGQARQGTQTRGQARRALREDTEAISRIARTMDLQNQFPLPTEDNDKLLLNAARGFAANALPLKAQFIAHEMPADFLEDLNAEADALEAAIAEHGNAVGDHVAAGAAIDDAIDRGMDTVHKLDPIVKKYANNPAALAEWTSASHTERAPRHAAAPSSTPPAGSSTPPAGSSTTSSAGQWVVGVMRSVPSA